jgi:hypothetical protein
MEKGGSLKKPVGELEMDLLLLEDDCSFRS